MLAYLRFRFVSIRSSPVRYLRFCFRVLTASRGMRTAINVRAA